MSKYIQVTTTFPTKEEAIRLSDSIVNEKLAACTQIIGPIISTYWWQEKIEKTEEWICLIKTIKRLYKELEALIKKEHSYKVPQIICIPITHGSNEYLRWIKEILI